MADFIQSVRISELQNKLSAWTSSSVQSYYGDKPGMNLLFPIAFEKNDSGYLTATGSSVELVQVESGDAFKLKQRNDADWTKFTALKTLESTGDFKTETVVYRETFTSTEYLEMQSPNREFGSNYVTAMMHGEIVTNDDHYAFLSNYVDAVGKILPHMVTAGGDKITIAIFNMSNWWKDSQGSYFTNLDSDWSVSLENARDVMQSTINLITSPSGAKAMFSTDVIANETLDLLRSEMEAKWLI